MDLTSKESEVSSSSGLEVRKQEAEADGEASGEKDDGGETEGEVRVGGPLDCSLSPPALSPDNLHESAAKVMTSQQCLAEPDSRLYYYTVLPTCSCCL